MPNGYRSAKFWQGLTVLFALVAIGAIGFYIWEARQPIFDRVTGKKIAEVNATLGSEDSQAQLNEYIKTQEFIMGVNVIKVDFRQNTRATVFRSYKNPEVEAAWQRFLKTGRKAELFGRDEQKNQRLVNLINGQFSCVATSETVAAELVPEILKYSRTTCMAPIPPGFGDFVGFVNIFLYRDPTQAEVRQMEDDMRKIARDIYERDIVKSSKRMGE